MPLSDPTGYVIFEAAYAYDPDHADEIQLRIGDRCWVQKPCAEPRGWLYGFNLNTRETGQFPGTYCHIFSADAGPPPIPPKPQVRHNKIVLNGHMLQRFHNTVPIFCENCYDYIWGSSFDCIICTGCHLASHTNCHKLFEGGAGCPKTDTQVRRVPDEYKKPFHDWTNNDILVWVLAAHLHPYLLQIKASNIDGFRLLNMNRSQLQTYGVEFEPHQVSFLECITELKTQPKENFTNIDLREPPQHIGTHKMIEHTFTTRQQCNYCYKNMFGIIRQGIMCLDCGVQYHRSCAVYCAHPCPGNDVTRSRRASHSHDPSFCCNFNSVEIPPVMANCITAVTNAGLHTKNIYKSSGPYEGYRSLRVALNQDSRKVNMTNWSDPLSAASVLKTFLLELPEPLIPFDSYPSFLNLAYYEQFTDDDVMDMIHRQLPPSNREHLKHLIQHLINVAQYSNENGMTIEELAKVFSYLVLRPREKDGKIFTENLDVQILAFIRMVRACESHFGATSLAEDFDESKWLWPEATRKDVTMRLSGTPDGSFCIRQSERCRGEWTLTVRKEGRERLIRIIQRNQNGAPCFGFREELLNFGSLEDLVLHFRDNSLEDYNSKLNIKLLHPCGKPDQLNITEGQQDMLVDQARYEELVEKLNHIKFMELKLEEQQLALEECKTLVESQTDVVNFLEEQMELAERIKKEAPTSDKSDLENSIVSMKEFLNMEKAKWHEMDDMLTKLKQECDQISTQLTELSAGVPGLTDEYNQLERLLQKNDPNLFAEKHGEDGLEEKDMQKFEVIYDTAERYITNTDLQDNFWLFDTTNISRDRARDMLQGKPDGTFFVRSSSNYPYVISMVHNGQIKHIPILQDPNTFHYGFAPPHNIYPTLASLINHYHNQSLRMHNRTLDTTLAFPYGFLEQEEEPIYD